MNPQTSNIKEHGSTNVLMEKERNNPIKALTQAFFTKERSTVLESFNGVMGQLMTASFRRELFKVLVNTQILINSIPTAEITTKTSNMA